MVIEQFINGQDFTRKVGVLYTLRSVKGTDFIGAITIGNGESANIAGLAGSKIVIKSVRIASIQQLDYDLYFFTNDTFQNIDIDSDTFLGKIDLDLVNNGGRIASGTYAQYYMSVERIDFNYVDEDDTDELHLMLVNRSAAAKNAGVTGDVVIEITYEASA